MSGPRFLQAGEAAIATEGIEWLKGKDGVNDPLDKEGDNSALRHCMCAMNS